MRLESGHHCIGDALVMIMLTWQKNNGRRRRRRRGARTMFITMLTRFTWGITVRPTVTPAIASDTAFSLYILHRIIFVAIDKTRILLAGNDGGVAGNAADVSDV